MTTTVSEKKLRSQPQALNILLSGGVAGPLLFILVFLIEGVLRPGYNPWRHFVSSLSQGEAGWVQIANFIVCGALVLGFAIGLRRVLYPGKSATWGPILLGIFGISLIGAGVFVTDPMLGYPVGAPETVTKQGTMHMLLSLFAFAALIAACFVLARRFAADRAWRGWSVYSILTGIAVAILFILTDVIASTVPNGPAGLVQRLTIITGWGWVALLALRLMRKGAPAG